MLSGKQTFNLPMLGWSRNFMILTSRNNYINKTKVLYRTSKINENFVTLGAYHLHRKPGILVGKWNRTDHSSWKISKIIGYRLSQCIFSFPFDTNSFSDLPILHLEKLQPWIEYLHLKFQPGWMVLMESTPYFQSIKVKIKQNLKNISKKQATQCLGWSGQFT